MPFGQGPISCPIDRHGRGCVKVRPAEQPRSLLEAARFQGEMIHCMALGGSLGRTKTMGAHCSSLHRSTFLPRAFSAAPSEIQCACQLSKPSHLSQASPHEIVPPPKQNRLARVCRPWTSGGPAPQRFFGVGCVPMNGATAKIMLTVQRRGAEPRCNNRAGTIPPCRFGLHAPAMYGRPACLRPKAMA